MTEQVSALMDDQLDGPECDGCMRRLKAERELRESWDLYHLIGDALRDTAGASLPASFAARLAAEPTVLAPGRAASARPRTLRYALSAAASVAAVAAVGWVALPMFQPSSPTAGLPSPPTLAGGMQPASPLVPVAQGVGDYLLAHQRYSAAPALAGGLVSYVRTVQDSGNR